jgi:hypothetical protein
MPYEQNTSLPETPKLTLALSPPCTQFPVRLAFAMTINKAQGQTLQRVGVCLDTPCFSHGQLYVAASRVGDPSGLKFAVEPDGNGCFYTPNIVYKEALTSGTTASPQQPAQEFAWGAYDPDHGEYRSIANENGRCCVPPPLHVPHHIYVRLSQAELEMNAPVLCDE